MKKLIILFLILIPVSTVLAAGPKDPDQKPNRLIKEASPYLRQHAYNPVDWYPWGKEAFEKARKENKPILLSVGYSTCHWCHVMERESYSDKGIAEELNKNFVAIKVDRERRPDVDETYMIATELITKTGGWPNHVFLTPDLKPFYGGTYFPRKTFMAVLKEIKRLWDVSQPDLKKDAERISNVINTVLTRRHTATDISEKALDTSVATLLKSYDQLSGGFSQAPKFPQESILLFLLHLAEQDGNKKALGAVKGTLNAILNGGIHDQIGGGFHRYAIDPQWHVPHFEKMLYNQALIGRALIRAYRITDTKRYGDAARRTLDSVLRDMTSPEGAFYSAYDADSDGHEGLFYVWTLEELNKVLTKEEAEFAIRAYSVTKEGNFEGRSILLFADPPAEIATELKMTREQFDTKLDAIRKKLLEIRKKRNRPHRDDKIVTSWNGMMITTFAEGAEILKDDRFKQAAIKAAEFLWANLRKGETQLYRSYFNKAASLDGSLDDYAATALAFISLYDLTGNQVWLDRAETLSKEVISLFEDKKAGDYYMSASQQTFTRAKPRSDSATPSASALTLELFAKLVRRSKNPDHRVRAEALTAAVSGLALDDVSINAYAIKAADLLLRGEPGAQSYMAKGVVKASAQYEPDKKQVNVSINIAKGWHINAHKPLEDFFIPTTLTLLNGDNKEKATYPKPIRQKLGFHDKELALYEGNIRITIPLDMKSKKGKIPEKVKLHLQACSDKICLDPETALLSVY